MGKLEDVILPALKQAKYGHSAPVPAQGGLWIGCGRRRPPLGFPTGSSGLYDPKYLKPPTDNSVPLTGSSVGDGPVLGGRGSKLSPDNLTPNPCDPIDKPLIPYIYVPDEDAVDELSITYRKVTVNYYRDSGTNPEYFMESSDRTIFGTNNIQWTSTPSCPTIILGYGTLGTSWGTQGWFPSPFILSNYYYSHAFFNAHSDKRYYMHPIPGTDLENFIDGSEGGEFYNELFHEDLGDDFLSSIDLNSTDDMKRHFKRNYYKNKYVYTQTNMTRHGNLVFNGIYYKGYDFDSTISNTYYYTYPSPILQYYTYYDDYRRDITSLKEYTYEEMRSFTSELHYINAWTESLTTYRAQPIIEFTNEKSVGAQHGNMYDPRDINGSIFILSLANIYCWTGRRGATSRMTMDISSHQYAEIENDIEVIYSKLIMTFTRKPEDFDFNYGDTVPGIGPTGYYSAIFIGDVYGYGTQIYRVEYIFEGDYSFDYQAIICDFGKYFIDISLDKQKITSEPYTQVFSNSFLKDAQAESHYHLGKLPLYHTSPIICVKDNTTACIDQYVALELSVSVVNGRFLDASEHTAPNTHSWYLNKGWRFEIMSNISSDRLRLYYQADKNNFRSSTDFNDDEKATYGETPLTFDTETRTKFNSVPCGSDIQDLTQYYHGGTPLFCNVIFAYEQFNYFKNTLHDLRFQNIEYSPSYFTESSTTSENGDIITTRRILYIYPQDSMQSNVPYEGAQYYRNSSFYANYDPGSETEGSLDINVSTDEHNISIFSEAGLNVKINLSKNRGTLLSYGGYIQTLDDVESMLFHTNYSFSIPTAWYAGILLYPEVGTYGVK